MDFNMEKPNTENKEENTENFNKEDAREVLEKELSLPENKEDMEKKINEAVDSPSFLEKIRNSTKLKKALKVALLGIALMKAEPAIGQDKKAEQKDSTKIEYVQNREFNLQENLNLLSEDEYIVPENVMVAFAEVVDPKANAMGTPAGGYFNQNFLNTKDKVNQFKKKLESLGYAENQIKSLEKLFTSEDVIVFNQNKLEDKNFVEILAHEKLHKKINHLPQKKKEKLNEARDFILKDFREKQKQWEGKIDSVYQEFKSSKMTATEYVNKVREIKREANPILLDKNGDTTGLIPVKFDSNEFYNYLAMDEFQDSVLDYIKENFPESYKIYSELQEEINNELKKKL